MKKPLKTLAMKSVNVKFKGEGKFTSDFYALIFNSLSTTMTNRNSIFLFKVCLAKHLYDIRMIAFATTRQTLTIGVLFNFPEFTSFGQNSRNFAYCCEFFCVVPLVD